MLHDAGGPPMGKPSLPRLWTDSRSLSFALARPWWMARAELWLSAWPLPARGTCRQLTKVHCSSLLSPDCSGPRASAACTLHGPHPSGRPWLRQSPTPGLPLDAGAPLANTMWLLLLLLTLLQGLPPALPLDLLHFQQVRTIYFCLPPAPRPQLPGEVCF